MSMRGITTETPDCVLSADCVGIHFFVYVCVLGLVAQQSISRVMLANKSHTDDYQFTFVTYMQIHTHFVTH